MRRRAIAAGLLLALVAASCGTSPGVSTERVDEIPTDSEVSGPDAPSTDDGTIAWGRCDEENAGADLECGTLMVPLDYSSPDGQLIDLAVARVATAEQDERIGSLVFNPGGPGGSGIDFLRSAALVVPSELSRRFDLVSFDPRGVGRSTAVECDVPLDDEVTLLDRGDDAGWAELVADAEALPSTCTRETIAIAPQLGTNNAARDLDELRAALGDDDLSYVGFSYGTRLGATYAHLFPDHVRALVLDGAVKPTVDFSELDADRGASLDRAFEAFATACDTDDECVLADVGPTLAVYDRLRADLAASGGLVTDQPDRVLSPGELQLAVIAALYDTQLWPVLAEGLRDAATTQDGTVLHVLVDLYLGRQPDGTYDNSQVAGFTINCADDADRPPVDVVRSEAEDAASQSMYFDEFLRASTGCLGGPAPVDPLVIGSAPDAPPILVIGNTGDPATPYEWSVELAEYLVSAELYTVDADGHTAFLSISCVEPVVVDYLVDLVLPEAGSSCSDEGAIDVFPPVGESEFEQIIALLDCLRSNGADIPEVDVGDLLADPSGEVLLDAIDPTDPVFGAALLACEDLIPEL